MAEERIQAWHFLPDNGRMQWGKWKPVRAGVTYVCKGPVVLCQSGLHASIRAIDALAHAPGSIICRVECWGDVAQDTQKLACRRRRVLWMADATTTLREFACWCAEQALDLVETTGGTVDPRSRNAIAVSRAYNAGKATKEELDAARAAAWAAARDAAWAAARDAAWDAARDAAWDAAWAAARAAAWDAARAAAWAAAWDAAWDAQNAKLEELLLQLNPAIAGEGTGK